MEKRVFNVNNHTVIRVQKRTAEKFYNNGKDVIIAPCFSNLHSPFCLIWQILQKNNQYFDNFEKAVNYYTYYNCCNELGRYPAFYIYEDDMK